MIDRGKSDFDQSKFFEILKRDFLTNNKPKLRLLWSFLDHFIIFYGQIDTHSGLFRLLKTFSFSTDQIDGSKLHHFRGKPCYFDRKFQISLKWPFSTKWFLKKIHDICENVYFWMKICAIAIFGHFRKNGWFHFWNGSLFLVIDPSAKWNSNTENGWTLG